MLQSGDKYYYLKDIDISVEKETHNLEYIIIFPVAIVILLLFKYLGFKLPEEYSIALFGVSFYTPITRSILDIYSLFKTGGRYVYKIKIQSYNILVEVAIGLFAYIISQVSLYILGLTKYLFTLNGALYFIIAYTGIAIVRLIDRKIIEQGGIILLIFGYIFTFVELFLYSLFFISLL